MVHAYNHMDTIPELRDFQVNGLGVGLGLFQNGILNGVGIGGGFIARGNGVAIGAGHIMYKANGLIVGGFLNEIAEVQGLEAAAFFNSAGFKMQGVQLALLVNMVSGHFVRELDPEGDVDSLSDVAKGLIGVQIAAFNIVEWRARGLQVGILNKVQKRMEGVQIGLINRCGSLRGVQIGLTNVCGERGVPFLRVKLRVDKPAAPMSSSELLPR